jgi:hypothetical protein
MSDEDVLEPLALGRDARVLTPAATSDSGRALRDDAERGAQRPRRRRVVGYLAVSTSQIEPLQFGSSMTGGLENSTARLVSGDGFQCTIEVGAYGDEGCVPLPSAPERWTVGVVQVLLGRELVATYEGVPPIRIRYTQCLLDGTGNPNVDPWVHGDLERPGPDGVLRTFDGFRDFVWGPEGMIRPDSSFHLRSYDRPRTGYYLNLSGNAAQPALLDLTDRMTFAIWVLAREPRSDRASRAGWHALARGTVLWEATLTRTPPANPANLWDYHPHATAVTQRPLVRTCTFATPTDPILVGTTVRVALHDFGVREGVCYAPHLSP